MQAIELAVTEMEYMGKDEDGDWHKDDLRPVVEVFVEWPVACLRTAPIAQQLWIYSLRRRIVMEAVIPVVIGLPRLYDILQLTDL
jgi:hypothetical protein